MLLSLLLTVVLVLWLRFMLQLLSQERRHRQMLEGLAPNVSRIPLIGAVWQMRNFQPDNLHEKFAEYVKRYGRSFVATTCGRMVLVTAEPRHVDALLLSRQHLRKSIVYGALGGWLGNGLLLSRGDHWHAMRKIITPSFHFTILEQYVEVFDRQSNILVSKLKPLAAEQQAFNIYPYLCLTALDIISETAMGVSVNAQENVDAPVVQAVKDVTNILATRFMRPHLLPPPLFRLLWPSGFRKQWDGIKCLHDFTDEIIKRRCQLLQDEQRQQPVERFALLDALLQARLAGTPLTDAQIRDEVSTFIFAGHDTSTSAASFCLYLLSRHPEVQQRLFEELLAHYGNAVDREVVYSDLAELPYLHSVIKETLRLYPPIPAVGRCLESDLTLREAGEARVPAGTNVLVLLWQLMRDEQLYTDPLRFWPERHLPGGTPDAGVALSSTTHLPFSAGPRNCIGQRFALLELKTIVIKLLRHFKLLPLGEEIRPSIKIVLRSASGVNLGLKIRQYPS